MRKIFTNPSRDSLDQGFPQQAKNAPRAHPGSGRFLYVWEIQIYRAQAQPGTPTQRRAIPVDRRRKSANGGRRALRRKDEEGFDSGSRAATGSSKLACLLILRSSSSKLRRRPLGLIRSSESFSVGRRLAFGPELRGPICACDNAGDRRPQLGLKEAHGIICAIPDPAPFEAGQNLTRAAERRPARRGRARPAPARHALFQACGVIPLD